MSEQADNWLVDDTIESRQDRPQPWNVLVVDDEPDVHQVTRLALNFEDHVSFVLGEDLVVRKLKFLDGALDQLEHIDEEGRRAELDARFALQSGEIRRLFLLLEQAFKLSKADS